MAFHTKRALLPINRFELAWKIKTNTNKFQIISVNRNSPTPLVTDGNEIIPSQNGSLLGLQLTSRGEITHAKQRVRQAKLPLAKCKRYSNCSEKVKIQLNKTLIRPVLEYPPIPLNTLSKSRMLKLQAVQNRTDGLQESDTPTFLEQNTYTIISESNQLTYGSKSWLTELGEDWRQWKGSRISCLGETMSRT